MALETQQPDTPSWASPRPPTTGRVIQYDLGLNFPQEKRYVEVDLAREDEGLFVEVTGGRYNWESLVLELPLVTRVNPRSKRRERSHQMPDWLDAVLDHLGVSL